MQPRRLPPRTIIWNKPKIIGAGLVAAAVILAALTVLFYVLLWAAVVAAVVGLLMLAIGFIKGLWK